MNIMNQFLKRHKKWFILGLMLAVFGVLYFVQFPIYKSGGNIILDALYSGLMISQDYAREHTLTCLIPAFFIAGSISVFLNKGSILKLLGKDANKFISYGVASVSGGILAVCSCTILPLFEGIRRKGAGLGPAIAFLFSGPAINITAIFLMANVFGWHYSGFRLIASVIIAIISGLVMGALFKEEEMNGNMFIGDEESEYKKPVIGLFFISQLAILIGFSLQGIPISVKLSIAGVSVMVFLYILIFKYSKADSRFYLNEVWSFVKRILPYLFLGIFIAGVLKIIVPESVVVTLVGDNSIWSNLLGGTFGMLTYFATLTEIPIVQGFIDLGMAEGPAMTLFLTGNSLSLPSFLVLTKNLGLKKVLVYYAIVLILSGIAGYIFGILV
jgi:hypothetical protein